MLLTRINRKGEAMKLKEHVLKEHKNIRVERNGEKYVCRILQKGTMPYNIIAKYYGCSDNFYMDLTHLFYLKASRRYLMGNYQPVFKGRRWFGFPTFEDAIRWLKENGFKILPKIHRKLPFYMS